jgi:hypothetical protein
VRPPFRVAFQVDKSTSGQLNKMNIVIYNLAEQNRLTVVKDSEENKRIPISLSVGYDGRFETIFKGSIKTGANERQGADILTKIIALDGGTDGLESFTNRTVEGGARAVDACLADMPNTGIGKINVRPILSRPKILVGNSLRLIEDTIGPGESWYIDNEQLFIVSDDEVTSNFIPVVSAATGLISTPSRESSEVTFETKINPTIKIGSRVDLRSATAPQLNGVYKVNIISYAGDNFGEAWNQVCTGKTANNVRVI